MSRKRRNPVRTAPPNVANLPPTQNDIRVRAYEIYIARGDALGDALSDWLEAEWELCKKRTIPAYAASNLDRKELVLDDHQARLATPFPIQLASCPAFNASRRIGNAAVGVAVASTR